jgi:hypothetical protein
VDSAPSVLAHRPPAFRGTSPWAPPKNMTPEQATMWAAAIGALAGIGGAIVAGVIGFFTQNSLIRKEIRKAREQALYSKRLVTLQNVIYACDWILRMEGHEMIDDFGKSVWDHVTKENIANLAFIPKNMERDFDAVIHALFSGHALHNRATIDYQKIRETRDRFQDHLRLNYTENR